MRKLLILPTLAMALPISLGQVAINNIKNSP